MNNVEEAQRVADKARKSISDFCRNECKSYCCRKGFIRIRQDQIDLIATPEEKEKLNSESKLKELKFSGKFLLDFSNSLGGCPALSGTDCSIHKNPNRPKVCQDFPIFIEGNKIKISPRCFAQQENKFYPFIKEFEKLGFEVTEKME